MNGKTITKSLLLATTISGFMSAQAQVKVGDNPGTIYADAVLEMETTDKGMLLPRVELSATDNATPLGAFTRGMTVYNIAAAGSGATAVSEGIYYCDGVKWVRAQSQDLSIYGQDGALAGNRTVNLDGHDLMWSGAGNIGIGAAAPSNKLHINAVNPLRLEGLQPKDTTGGGATGTLVIDNNGVVKIKTDSSISAIQIRGNLHLTTNNVTYHTDTTEAPSESIDNLSEFSGHIFTARRNGLYMVNYDMGFYQKPGDAYVAAIYFTLNDDNDDISPLPANLQRWVKVDEPLPASTPVPITTSLNRIVRLKAGDRLSFFGRTYSSDGNCDAIYEINVSRID